MSAIWTMAMKDLRLLVRDKAGLFWLLMFPLIMALFFGSVMGGGGSGSGRGKLDVAFVDNTGGSSYVRKLRAKLGESDALNITDTTLEVAKQSVRLGRRQAYVAVYTDSISRKAISIQSGGEPRFEVGIDPSRQAESAVLQGLLTEAHFSIIMGQFQDASAAKKLFDENLKLLDSLPDSVSGMTKSGRENFRGLFSGLKTFYDKLEQENPTGSAQTNAQTGGPFEGPDITVQSVADDRVLPHSAFEITFPQAIIWGLLGCVTAFALSIVTERTHGTLIRLRLAPLSRAQIIGGKALACFLTALAISALLIAIGYAIFGVRIDDPLKLALAIGAGAICFTGIMMLIALLGKTERAVSGAGWGIMLVLSMIGGGMIPLFVMPSWMVTLASFSPVRWGITALEGAIWRGLSYQEMLLPVGILLAIGITSFTIGVATLSRRQL